MSNAMQRILELHPGRHRFQRLILIRIPSPDSSSFSNSVIDSDNDAYTFNFYEPCGKIVNLYHSFNSKAMVLGVQKPRKLKFTPCRMDEMFRRF